MIPNVVKGANMYGLIRYLQGEGKANEHENPHVVGGDDFLVAWYGFETLEQESVGEISDYLEEPRRQYGTVIRARSSVQDPETGERRFDGYKDQNVWHCSLSLRADEGVLSNEQWQQIAGEFMDEMGFTAASGRAPARWVAIHHGRSAKGNDHIHIAASMVREDGTRWEGRFHDFRRAQEACRMLENRHGLAAVGNTLGISERGVTPAEQHRTKRAGAEVLPSVDLAARVRAAAVASSSEAEWIRRVRGDGVVVKPFFAKGTTDVVTGYRAALKPRDRGERLRFLAGGTLGRDLSITRLRELWPTPDVEAADAASVEWQAAFRGQPPVGVGPEKANVAASASKVARDSLQAFNERLVVTPYTDHAAWADAARDVSGAMSAWARVDREYASELRTAASTLSRSAQVRRAPLPAGRRRRESAMGATFLLLTAKPEDRVKVMTALMVKEVITTAVAMAKYHEAAGDLRQAIALREQVVDRLDRFVAAGRHTEAWAQERSTTEPLVGDRVQVARSLTNVETSPERPDPLPRKLTEPRKQQDSHVIKQGDSHER